MKLHHVALGIVTLKIGVFDWEIKEERLPFESRWNGTREKVMLSIDWCEL